jgi:hypothetical protein
MSDLPYHHIPDELMAQLHRANEHFHASKRAWEALLEGDEFRHEERVRAAQQELLKAEREVEEAEDRIRQALSPAKRPGPSTSH